MNEGLERLTTAAGNRLTVLYDGGCPVCRREINHYRRLDTAGRVYWQDVAHQPQVLNGTGITPKQALAYFRVVEPDGQVVGGAHAFARLWQRLPGYRWLGFICRYSGLVWPMELIYRLIAAWRSRRRAGCPTCA